MKRFLATLAAALLASGCTLHAVGPSPHRRYRGGYYHDGHGRRGHDGDRHAGYRRDGYRRDGYRQDGYRQDGPYGYHAVPQHHRCTASCDHAWDGVGYVSIGHTHQDGCGHLFVSGRWTIDLR